MSKPTETLTEAIAVANATDPGLEKKRFSIFLWMAERGVVVFTVLLILAAAIFIDGFATLPNLTDVFYRALRSGSSRWG